MPAVDVDLRGDQGRPRELPFGVAGPAAGDEPAQGQAAHAAVQIEPVGRAERPQPARQIRDPFLRVEIDDAREVGILDDQRRHVALGDVIELGIGMTPVDRAHEGSSEKDVADRAEPDAKNA